MIAVFNIYGKVCVSITAGVILSTLINGVGIITVVTHRTHERLDYSKFKLPLLIIISSSTGA